MVKMKMKKVLSLVLAVLMLLTGFVFVNAAEKGDVDADGTVTASDARTALRFSVGLETPTEEQLPLADFDEDGTVTASDARLILRLSVGLTEEDEPEEPDEPEIPVEKPEHIPSARELTFYETLYATAHPQLGGHIKGFESGLLKNFQKWCCLYTIKYVFRPALEKAGYSKSEIDRLAPRTFSADSLAKLLSNVLGTSWSDKFVIDSLPLYIPSLLSDYYIKNPEVADVYYMYDFYDDMIEKKVYEHSDYDRKAYEPRIGDVLFMSNKERTYEDVDGKTYPTVDHTAQIIKVYDDGTFLCTEGSIIESSEGDGVARVRERRYRYNEEMGTYEFVNNPIVIVLYAAQPKF